MSILYKAVLLSWMATVVTIAAFLTFIIPQQRQSLLDSLHSNAKLITTSIAEVAAGAVVAGDYSTVADHCVNIVRSGESVRYIVIVRADGFALVHRATGWTNIRLGGEWLPQGARQSQGRIAKIFGDEVYHYSTPFDCSGLQWGWIHVGISLDNFNEDARSMYRRTSLLALICILTSLIATVLYARRLVQPIRHLTDISKLVASGDLSARASISSGDEVENLGTAFNQMTQTLQRVYEELSAARDYTSNILQSMSDTHRRRFSFLR